MYIYHHQHHHHHHNTNNNSHIHHHHSNNNNHNQQQQQYQHSNSFNPNHPFNRSISNEEFKPNKQNLNYQQSQANLYQSNSNYFKLNKFSDSMQNKYYSLNDENHEDCLSLSTSISSLSPLSIYSLSEKTNTSNSYSSLSLPSSFEESFSSSSLSSSLSSSSSSLSSCSTSPVWTSALYSPCLHFNLFKAWPCSSSLLLENYSNEYNFTSFSKNFDTNIDHSGQLKGEENYANRAFSLSSYSLDSKNSKKIDDFLNSQSVDNNNEIKLLINDLSNSDEENGQYLMSYQEMDNKVNDLLNCNETNKLDDMKSKRVELKEITNTKSKYFNSIHVNTVNSNNTNNNELESDTNSYVQSNKSTSPKPKFIAPRFERKWLENQNNSSLMGQQQSANLTEYSNKSQTFGKQHANFSENSIKKNLKANLKNHAYDTNSTSNLLNTTSPIPIKTNKKTYSKPAQQQQQQQQTNYFKRNNATKNNNNLKYSNQKSMPKRSYQCKCSNTNTKCACYSTASAVITPNTVTYSNENDFYPNGIANRNSTYSNNNNTNTNNSSNSSGYNYVQNQNYSPNQNQNRYRYTAKSRA